MKKLCGFLFTTMLSTALFATPQTMDRMWVEGSNLQILTNPLRPVFVSKSKEWLEEKWNPIVADHICSSNWSGFYAEWKLEDGMLFLKGLYTEPCGTESRLIDADILFPGENYPILADWYSGEIAVQVSTLNYLLESEELKEDGKRAWYKCESLYYQLEQGVLIGIRLSEAYEDCYVF